MVGGQEKDCCCVGAAQGLSHSAWRLSILSIQPWATHGLYSTPDNTPRFPRKGAWGQTRRSPLLHRAVVTPSAPPGAVPRITAQTLHGDLLWGWGVRVCWTDPDSRTPWRLTTHRTGMASPQESPEAPSSPGQGSPGPCDLPGETRLRDLSQAWRQGRRGQRGQKQRARGAGVRASGQRAQRGPGTPAGRAETASSVPSRLRASLSADQVDSF